MYELSIQRIFTATHAITIKGVPETPHNHEWVLSVVISGPELDDDGLLLDFHELESIIDRVIKPFVNSSFNGTPPFDITNPTAENIAEHIGRSLLRIFREYTDNHLSLKAIHLTEAPHCVASFLPGSSTD